MGWVERVCLAAEKSLSGAGWLHKIIFLLIFIGMFPLNVEAEDDSEGFAEKWQARATRTQAKQPKWSVPMVAPFPMLAQVYRSDFTRQITSTGAENWNMGSGKGFGRFDVMTSLGGGLPTSDARTNGRTIHANTVAQYHLGKYFWPEVEFNTTSYLGGARDGKTQTFITPGLMVGKFALRTESEKSRMGVAAGVAFQTALTSFHTYNHAVVVCLRFGF